MGKAQIAWSDFIQRHREELNFNHGWELRFVENVLRHVPGLDPATVEIQKQFKDLNGRSRRIDFAVVDGPVRLAIEVDGYDKTGRGAGMSRKEFDDFLSRQNALVQQGWTVLRFPNSRVRDEAAKCVREIQLSLLALKRTAEAGRLDNESSEAASIWEELRELRRENAEQNDKVGDLARRAEHDKRKQSPFIAMAAVGLVAAVMWLWRDLPETERDPTDPLVAEAPVIPTPANTTPISGATPRTLTGANQQDSSPPPVATNNVASQAFTTAQNAPTVGNVDPPPPQGAATPSRIPAESAGKYLGQRVTVCGLVAEVRWQGPGEPTYLNFERPFNARPPFSVMIPFGPRQAMVRKFGGYPEQTLQGHQVCASGLIYSDVARMTVSSPDSIVRSN